MAKITVEYCAQYNSYNGKEVNEGECLAPFIVSDEMYKSDDTIVKENLRTWKRFGAKFRVGFLITKIEKFNQVLSLYYSSVNDYFNEHPEYNPGRCVIAWDELGFPLLCSKENRCKTCPRRCEFLPRYKNLEDFLKFTSFQETSYDDEGNTLSLDVADAKAMPVEEEATLDVLFTQLVKHLTEINPRYATIVMLGKEGKSSDDIIAAIGLKTSRGYQEIAKAQELTEKFFQM